MSEKASSYDFYLNPSYIEPETVKRIGIDLASNSIAVEINVHLVLQTIQLDDFADKTIIPLKKQLGEVLNGNKDKQNIINSVITCINRNIDFIKKYQRQDDEHGYNNSKNHDDDNAGRKARLLVHLASLPENTESFFKNQYGEPHAATRVGKDRHLEIIPLKPKSSKCKYWLTKLFREHTKGQIISEATISNTINALAANATFDGQTIPLHLRVAWGNTQNRSIPGCIYYDMTDDARRVIEISPSGWRIIEGRDPNVPILFKRHNQVAQAEPDRNYPPDIFDQFLDLTNIRNKDDRQLVKVYIVSLMIPEIAHVILNLHGSKGAAKSFLLRLIKMLIDPSKPELLTLHKDTAQFIQQVSHNYLPFYDNVKYISQELSDEICKAVTGIGSTKRELYTDDEDVVYDYKHCLSLNGINIALTESDALDRSMMIGLDDIKDEDRRKEEDLLAEFRRIRPKVFAYILYILAEAMRIKPTLHLPSLTRMADFTEWGEAISRAMGYEKMSFIRILNQNRNEQNIIAIEENIVGSLVVKFCKDHNECERDRQFEGSPADLRSTFIEYASNNEIDINNRQFPKTAAVLVRKLRIIKPNLKQVYGITVKIDRDSNNNSVISIYSDANNAANSNPTLNQAYALQVLHNQILR